MMLAKLIEKCPITFKLIRSLGSLNPGLMVQDKETCRMYFRQVVDALANRLAEHECEPVINQYEAFLVTIPMTGSDEFAQFDWKKMRLNEFLLPNSSLWSRPSLFCRTVRLLSRGCLDQGVGGWESPVEVTGSSETGLWLCEAPWWSAWGSSVKGTSPSSFFQSLQTASGEAAWVLRSQRSWAINERPPWIPLMALRWKSKRLGMTSAHSLEKLINFQKKQSVAMAMLRRHWVLLLR